jgi:hypothetical protein
MQGRVTKRKPANRGITKEDRIEFEIQTGQRDKLADGTPITKAREDHFKAQDKFEAKLQKQTEKQADILVEEVKQVPQTENPVVPVADTKKEAPKAKK